MKDLYQVLRQKESDILRVQREIEALLSVIPLLADNSIPGVSIPGVVSGARPENHWPLELDMSSKPTPPSPPKAGFTS
jgi:hypothetical protein